MKSTATARHRKHRRRRRLNPRFVAMVAVILLLLVYLIARPSAADDEILIIADPTAGTVADVSGEKGDTLGLVPLVHIVEAEEIPTEAVEEQEPPYTTEEVEVLAKMLWGEARGVQSTTEQAAVIWCVLNRVDHPSYPDTIIGVVTQKSQFHGYNPSHPLDADLVLLVEDVLTRWYAEKDGEIDSGRVLPRGYIYFYGDGERNHFTSEWLSDDTWGWHYSSPYED